MSDFETRADIKLMLKLEWKGTKFMKNSGKIYGIDAPKKLLFICKFNNSEKS